MPRYEKMTKDKEYFIELLLDSHRVYQATGWRPKGQTGWVMKDSDRRVHGFRFVPENAQPFYDERTADAVKRKFVLVGDETPELVELKASTDRDNQVPPEIAKAHEELQALLRAEGRVFWVGKGDRNADKFYEVVVEDKTVITRQGKIGSKGRTEKSVELNNLAAIFSAAGSLMTMRSFEFGPKD